MARKAGRKRKSGQRNPSGDIQREPRESAKIIALRMPHRRMAPLDSAHDQRAETPLGILNMIGAIPDREYEAAKWFARVVGRYRAVICAPSASPASIAGVFEPHTGGCGEIQDAAQRKADYDAAYEELSLAGHTSQMIVAKMAIHGEPCPGRGFPALIRGLTRLADHRELTNRPKSVSVGK